MSRKWFTAGALTLLASACIAPSVIEREDRAVPLGTEGLEWRAGAASDLPGTYVSTELAGPLATALRKIVYLFEAGGTYTGAGLIDDSPPRFEVISGHWRMSAEGLRLDGGVPATLEIAEDGSLRLSGPEGLVVLRREREQ